MALVVLSSGALTLVFTILFKLVPGSGCGAEKTRFYRNLPFNFIIGTPARNAVNNTKIRVSMSDGSDVFGP